MTISVLMKRTIANRYCNDSDKNAYDVNQVLLMVMLLMMKY